MVTFARRFIKLKRFVLIFLAGIVFSFLSAGAIAEPSVGSLALSDLDEILLNQSAELRQEVNQALEEAGKDDVGCVAPVIRLRFISDLNNSRISPFSCFFTDDKSLIIRARNLAILPNGQTVSLRRLLRRDSIPEGVDLQFALTSWRWTDANR